MFALRVFEVLRNIFVDLDFFSLKVEHIFKFCLSFSISKVSSLKEVM